jgi:hypothetical protein
MPAYNFCKRTNALSEYAPSPPLRRRLSQRESGFIKTALWSELAGSELVGSELVGSELVGSELVGSVLIGAAVG